MHEQWPTTASEHLALEPETLGLEALRALAYTVRRLDTDKAQYDEDTPILREQLVEVMAQNGDWSTLFPDQPLTQPTKDFVARCLNNELTAGFDMQAHDALTPPQLLQRIVSGLTPAEAQLFTKRFNQVLPVDDSAEDPAAYQRKLIVLRSLSGERTRSFAHTLDKDLLAKVPNYVASAMRKCTQLGGQVMRDILPDLTHAFPEPHRSVVHELPQHLGVIEKHLARISARLGASELQYLADTFYELNYDARKMAVMLAHFDGERWAYISPVIDIGKREYQDSLKQYERTFPEFASNFIETPQRLPAMHTTEREPPIRLGDRLDWLLANTDALLRPADYTLAINPANVKRIAAGVVAQKVLSLGLPNGEDNSTVSEEYPDYPAATIARHLQYQYEDADIFAMELKSAADTGQYALHYYKQRVRAAISQLEVYKKEGVALDGLISKRQARALAEAAATHDPCDTPTSELRNKLLDTLIRCQSGRLTLAGYRLSPATTQLIATCLEAELLRAQPTQLYEQLAGDQLASLYALGCELTDEEFCTLTKTMGTFSPGVRAVAVRYFAGEMPEDLARHFDDGLRHFQIKVAYIRRVFAEKGCAPLYDKLHRFFPGYRHSVVTDLGEHVDYIDREATRLRARMGSHAFDQLLGTLAMSELDAPGMVAILASLSGDDVETIRSRIGLSWYSTEQLLARYKASFGTFHDTHRYTFTALKPHSSAQQARVEVYEATAPAQQMIFSAIAQYLSLGKDARRALLLTAEQEVQLAQTIEAGVTARQLREQRRDRAAGQEINEKIWSLRTATERDLDMIAAKGDIALTRFVSANVGLAFAFMRETKSKLGSKMEDSDLVIEAMKGVVRAVRKFDYTEGLKFSTYASNWIVNFVTRGVAMHERGIPLRVTERLVSIRKASGTFRAQFYREPTLDEISAATKLSVDQIKTALAHPRAALIFSQIGNGDDVELARREVDAIMPADQHRQGLVNPRRELRHGTHELLAGVFEPKSLAMEVTRAYLETDSFETVAELCQISRGEAERQWNAALKTLSSKYSYDQLAAILMPAPAEDDE